MLGIGIAWFAIELVLMALGPEATDPSGLLERGTSLLLWQLGLFALLGLALAPLAVLRAWSAEVAVWGGIAVASSFFLAARVAEGLVRQNSPALAVLSVAVLSLGIGGALVALRAFGRRLPDPWRRGWPLAVWSSWSLVLVCFLRRAGPALGNGKIGPLDGLQLFDAGELVMAAAIGGAILVLSTGLRRALAAASVVIASVLPGVGAGSPVAAEESRPDVIVILVDTYRFDHLGANVARADLTPHLDRLAEESIRFTRAFSPSNVTAHSMPGVLASLAPRTAERRLPEEADSLAELLHDAGYTTLGISTNPNVSAQFGYQQGFDEFVDPTGQPDFLIANMLQIVGFAAPAFAYKTGIVDAGLYYRPARDVGERGLRLLGGASRPTLLYLHTMDPHGPYLPPRSFLPGDFSYRDFYPYYRFNELSGRGLVTSPGFAHHLRNLRQRYEGEVRYSDAELGRLIEALRAQGRWDESLVWLLSDHGEAFGEHDYTGHGGENLTTTLIRVPLLVKPPKSWGIAPRVEETPVSTYDLLPTTLSMLGRPPPKPPVFGIDLSGLIRTARPPARGVLVSYGAAYRRGAGTVLETYAAIDWPWKLDLMLEAGQRNGARLFDLATDPGETKDLWDREPEAGVRLEREILAWRAREDEYLFGTPSAPVDDRLREQLRNLGYVE